MAIWTGSDLECGHRFAMLQVYPRDLDNLLLHGAESACILLLSEPPR